MNYSLIMTILGSSQFFAGLDNPMDALPLRIWRFSLQPYDEARVAGWGAALVLYPYNSCNSRWSSLLVLTKGKGKGLMSRINNSRV